MYLRRSYGLLDFQHLNDSDRVCSMYCHQNLGCAKVSQLPEVTTSDQRAEVEVEEEGRLKMKALGRSRERS